MSFDTTAKVSLTLDQVLALVDQLSDKEIEKVAERVEQRRKRAAGDRIRKTFSKVKLNRKEIDKVVEEVRNERYEKRAARR